MIRTGKKIVLFVSFMLFLCACTPQTINNQMVEVTKIVENTVIVTQLVYRVITATEPVLTQTNELTITPTSTDIPTNIPTVQSGIEPTPTLPLKSEGTEEIEDFMIWCAKYPADKVDPAAPWKMTNEAHEGRIINDYTQVVFPNEFCVVVLNFGKTINIETTGLSIYEYNQSSPWLKTNLFPVDGMDGIYFAVLDHPYILNPPLWFVFYQFKIEDSEEGEMWSRYIEFTRGWLPEKRCWDGSYPNPISLKCPTQPEWEPIHTGFWEYKETVAAIDQDK